MNKAEKQGEKMKKILIIAFSMLLIIFGIVGFILFTQPGNNILKPIIENKINEKLPKKIVLSKFTLTPSTINTTIQIDENSFINAKGSYSIFSKSFDIDYEIKISDLSKIAPLIDMKLRGGLNTEGNVKGDISSINIKGFTDIADSKSSYEILLKDFNPLKVIADINSLKVEKILYMLYQPQFLKGELNSDIVLISLDPKNLKGYLKANLKNGFVDTKIMKKDYNVTLPKTTINMNADAKLDKTDIDYSAKILSNLAKVVSAGKINSENMGFDAKYFVLFKELALLKPVTNFELKGPLKTEGKIKGDKKLLKIVGKSDVANSSTLYKISLKDFKPDSADIDIKDAKLAKILYMLNQPIYADADIVMKAKLSSLDVKNLNGKIKTLVRNGKTNPKVLYKEFNLTDARISFDAIENTDIKNSIAKSNIKLNSSVAKIDINKAVFDINKNILTSDFSVNVPNLDKLYFVTKKHLKGSAKVIGDIKKDKDLIINAHTDILGGKVDAKLVNDEITKKIRGVKVTALTDMLMYPRVFDSSMDADIKYNLKTKKGILNAKLFKGRILPNQMTFLLNQMAKFDITKEIYDLTTVDSKIDNMVIISNLDMKSRLTHITSKDAILDMNKNRVDAKLKIDIKDKPVFVKIRGDINSPKVSVDAGAILKEKIEKKLEKKVPKQYQEPLKQIMKLF